MFICGFYIFFGRFFLGFVRMDKNSLNNEIVLCRPAVRKARVVVIRKLLKKMKILKSCKLEGVKEKKFKKAERLFKRVQILKKMKEDDVTKFALKNRDLEIFLKGPKIDIKKSAFASLAKHEAVLQRVNYIRERIPNWEVVLPFLLDSLGKKKRKKTRVKKAPAEKVTGREAKKSNQLNESPEEDILEESEKISKIDDPFFIEKKVIPPKLILKSLSLGDNNRDKLEKSEFTRDFKVKVTPRDYKYEKFRPRNEMKSRKKSQLEKPTVKEKEETLHPSWAAKKFNLIKPFQGKKITFSDD